MSQSFAQWSKYASLKVTPYALPDLLYALFNNGFADHDVFITKEDNDLVVRFEMKTLENAVYPIKKSKGETCVCLDAGIEHSTKIETEIDKLQQNIQIGNNDKDLVVSASLNEVHDLTKANILDDYLDSIH